MFRVGHPKGCNVRGCGRDFFVEVLQWEGWRGPGEGENGKMDRAEEGGEKYSYVWANLRKGTTSHTFKCKFFEDACLWNATYYPNKTWLIYTGGIPAAITQYSLSAILHWRYGAEFMEFLITRKFSEKSGATKERTYYRNGESCRLIAWDSFSRGIVLVLF